MLFNFKLFSLLNSFTFKSHHAASSAIEISVIMHLSISRYSSDMRLKGEVQHAVRMVLDLLLLYVYYEYNKLTKT